MVRGLVQPTSSLNLLLLFFFFSLKYLNFGKPPYGPAYLIAMFFLMHISTIMLSLDLIVDWSIFVFLIFAEDVLIMIMVKKQMI